MLRLKYQKGRTINLGNFESVRVDIGIEADIAEGLQDKQFEQLKAWVESKLAEESKS